MTDVDHEQRLQAVLAMRRHGLTFPQIARVLGVSKQRAYQLWQEAGRCRSAQRRLAASDSLPIASDGRGHG